METFVCNNCKVSNFKKSFCAWKRYLLQIWSHTYIYIYVNDLPQVVESLIALFADDTKLYCSITSDLDSIQLQIDIDNFLEWSQLWLLNMNNNKCKGMRITISDRSPLIYMLDGEQLNVVSHQKDLGINLNFISTLHLLLPRQIHH